MIPVWSAIARFPGASSGVTTTRSGTARSTSTTTRASIAILHGRDGAGRRRRSLRNRGRKQRCADRDPGRADRAQEREAEEIADQERPSQCPDSGRCAARARSTGQPSGRRARRSRTTAPSHQASAARRVVITPPPGQGAGELHQENHRGERAGENPGEGGESPCVRTGGDPVSQSGPASSASGRTSRNARRYMSVSASWFWAGNGGGNGDGWSTSSTDPMRAANPARVKATVSARVGANAAPRPFPAGVAADRPDPSAGFGFQPSGWPLARRQAGARTPLPAVKSLPQGCRKAAVEAADRIGTPPGPRVPARVSPLAMLGAPYAQPSVKVPNAARPQYWCFILFCCNFRRTTG